MGCDHIRALDPELMCAILKRVPDIDRLRNVPLVSLCLSEACRDPALWPDLRVQCADFQTEADWSSFLRWLVPRASGLQTLQFNDPEDDLAYRDGIAWAPRGQALMAVLAVRAPQLRRLALRYPPSAQKNHTAEVSACFPLADLTHFSQLTSLVLGLGQTSIKSAPLAAALRGLPALEHLGLTCTRCAWECLVSVATSCPQLTCLQVGSGLIHGEGHWEQPLEAPEEIGLLTNLVELTIANLQLCSLPDSISKLTSLQRLLIDNDGDVLVELPSGHGLTACKQLSQLRIMSDKASPVLADLTFLRQLEISDCREELPNETFWPRLTGLTELKLGLGAESNNEVFEGLVGMTGLRKLILVHALALHLPEGPYLDALESLCLQTCTFSGGLPSVLAAATKLRHIELTGYHNAYQRPGLLFSLLGSLQALETVRLSHAMDAIPLSWNDASQQYRFICSGQDRSPVAITLT